MAGPRASWFLVCLVCFGCGSTAPRVESRPLAFEEPTGLRLDVAMARVRELVRSRPGEEPIRDPALEAWLSKLVLQVRGVTGRGALPFELGEERRPVTGVSYSYAGRERELVDGDLATTSLRIGSLSRAFVIIDGDAHIGFVRDSIVVATGRLAVAHAYDSVIVAGGGLDVSHASGYGRRPSQLPSLLVTGVDLRVSHADGAIFAAAEGVAAAFDGRATFVSSPVVDLIGHTSTDAGLVLSDITISPLEQSLEVGVGEGRVPRVCVYERGSEAATCALQGERLGGTLSDWRVSFSSPRVVVLANGRERIRLVPTRGVSAVTPARRSSAGAELHVVGVYEPELPEGRVPVRIERRGAAIWLVLMSHHVVEWDVEVVEGVELAGVLLAGWGLSRVRGLPPGTPVLTRVNAIGERGFSAHERSGRSWTQVTTMIEDALGWSGAPTSFTGMERASSGITIR